MLQKVSKFAARVFDALFSFTPKKVSFLIVLAFVFLFTLENILDIEARVREDNVFAKFSWLRNLDYDFHLKQIPKRAPSQDVVIIEINEPTLKALGRFPFSRNAYVKLIENLNAAGAAVLAFDMAFAENEQESTLTSLRSILPLASQNSPIRNALEIKMQEIDGDGALLKTLQASKMPVVLGYAFDGLETKQNAEERAKGGKGYASETQLRTLNVLGYVRRSGLMQNEPKDALQGVHPVLPIDRYTVESFPAPSIVSLGSFNATIDSDGVIRTTPLVMRYQEGVYGSLSLKALQAYWKSEASVVRDGNGYAVEFRNSHKVPMNKFGALPVKFYGYGKDFKYLEMIDVINGKFDPGTFKNKIVFLGVTAIGLKDLRTTPMVADFPGVEVHASIVSNILQKDYLLRTSDYYLIGYLLLSIFAFAWSLSLFRMHPLMGLGVTVFAIAVIQWGGQNFFFNHGLIVPTMLPSLQLLCIFFSALLYRYLSTEKEKKFVREAFGRYVSGAVVEEMLKDQSKLKLGGQKKRLTVLFTDMVGFTKLSETLDAQTLSALLNEFFTAMTKIILDNKGTLDKYMGDAIMCFWGAPLENPRHGIRACRSALAMQEELIKINARWQQKYGFTVQMRIGINTGDMSVGNMGSEQVFSYTVLGDNVNLGSRLEGVNNLYGTKIIVGEETYEAAKEEFFFRELDLIAVKGKQQATKIYELLGTHSQSQEMIDWVQAFQRARELYVNKNWEEASRAFALCLTINPEDKAAKVFQERIAELEQNTPEDWEGVWKLTSK